MYTLSEGVKYMNSYVTGAMIKKLREEKNLTQEQLAQILNVSGKTVSKWETGQGLPDISLLEPIARALDISVIELFKGENVVNRNRASNVLKSVCYVCPVCGNGILALGQAVVSCCGITLPEVVPEEANEEHAISCVSDDGEYLASVDHPMQKGHYITCLIAVSDNEVQYVKLYPEGEAMTRFRVNRVKRIYAYCNRHGMFKIEIGRKKK